MYKDYTEQDIKNIYTNIVKKNSAYLNKRSTLSIEDKIFLDNVLSSPNYKWNKKDFPRTMALLDFKEWILEYNISPKNLCCTSKDDPELKIISSINLQTIEYNGSNGDLHNVKINNKCDFFLFNQTIEHLYNPFKAVKNIYNQIDDGGYIYTSLPTINIPHMVPIHFNGYTPMGVAMLFLSCGFNVLKIGQWGNYNYINKLFSTHIWPGYDDIKDNIINEERNVCQCWILCKK